MADALRGLELDVAGHQDWIARSASHFLCRYSFSRRDHRPFYRVSRTSELVAAARLLGFNGLMAFWGGLGIIFGAAGAAFSNVLLKARAIQLAPAMIAAWQMIFGTAPLLLTGFMVEGNPLKFHWSAVAIACLLYLAIIGSALTFLLLYW